MSMWNVVSFSSFPQKSCILLFFAPDTLNGRPQYSRCVKTPIFRQRGITLFLMRGWQKLPITYTKSIVNVSSTIKKLIQKLSFLSFQQIQPRQRGDQISCVNYKIPVQTWAARMDGETEKGMPSIQACQGNCLRNRNPKADPGSWNRVDGYWIEKNLWKTKIRHGRLSTSKQKNFLKTETLLSDFVWSC